MLVTANQTLLDEVNLIVSQIFAGCWVHLFVNEYYPTPEMLLGDFAEASFVGYVPRLVTSWSAARLNMCGAAISFSAPEQVWTVAITGGHDLVWGYWLETAAGVLLAGENIGKPRPMFRAGQQTALVPNVTLQSG